MLNKLAKRFPKKFAKMNHDYVGLMTGKRPEEIKKIFICLDMDYDVLDQVIEAKPDVVITHHPFIFGTKAKVFKYDLMKKELAENLDSLNIPV